MTTNDQTSALWSWIKPRITFTFKRTLDGCC